MCAKKQTKASIVAAIMEKVDAHLATVGEEDKSRWKFNCYAITLFDDDDRVMLMTVINGSRLNERQYKVFRAIQTGLFVYMEDIAGDGEMLARLVCHWFDNSNNICMLDDAFSKTTKGVLNEHVLNYDPTFFYHIVTNDQFRKSPKNHYANKVY